MIKQSETLVKQRNDSLKEIKNDVRKKFKIDFRRIGQMILHPRSTLSILQTENKKADWMSPIIVVCAILLLSGFLSVTASTSVSTSRNISSSSSASDFMPGGMGGGMPSSAPNGNMGMQVTATAESADQKTTEETATKDTGNSSSLLIKILSILGIIISFIVTWLILGSLVNLFAIAFGGQANMHIAMVFAAWSTIPIGIRGLMQIMYALATTTSIKSVGLSGFAPSVDTSMAILLGKLLEQIDVYLIWQMILLVIGIGIMTQLDRKKPILIALSSTVTIMVIKCLFGLGLEKLSSLNLSSSVLNRLIR
jgi:hypothetical protein